MDNMVNESGVDNDWITIAPFDRAPLGTIVENSLNCAVVKYPICLGLDGFQ